MKEFEIASARKLAVLAAYSTDVGREPFPPPFPPHTPRPKLESLKYPLLQTGKFTKHF